MKRYLLALALSAPAFAQQAWNENQLAWEAPTTCTDSQPISACPLTNYRVYRSATTEGGYTLLGTSVSLTFRHVNAAAGNNCYHVTAITGAGQESAPSVVACKVNVRPPSVPNPPTNLRFVTVAAVRAGAPAFSILGQAPPFRVGEFYGVIPAGRPCGDYLVTFRGQRLHRVIPERGETWGWDGARPLAAPCGPSA